MVQMENQETISLNRLFHGHERTLAVCLIELAAGLDVNTLARKRIEPVLSDLEANAGQPMDAKFIAYMCQYSLYQANQ